MRISHKFFDRSSWVEWGAGVFACLAATIFIVVGLRGISFGFPLDDAWIHQTYARNLAQTGTWSFIPGKVSGGSTSPLWTILLALGHLISESVAWFWTLALSIVAMGLVVVLLVKMLRNYQIQDILLVVPFMFLVGLEWHLHWAVASGMETMLYCLGICAIMYLLFTEQPKWGWIGILLGLLLWIRPDGLTMLGPICVIGLVELSRKKIKIRALLPGMVGFTVLAAGYLILNKITTGNIFPNTYYAKQMEYQELWALPFLQRVINEFQVWVVGPGIIVLPGFLYAIYWSIKAKDWKLIAFIIWGVAFGVLYALRLPVTYQHGRYMIPVLPVYLFIGYLGSMQLLKLIVKESTQKVIQFAFSASVILTSLGFYLLGISTYQQDVKTINTLMVEPAKGIAVSTQKSDVIAVHDIGAMGYFSDREIIDLAGLVNPEVIPFIRDEPKLLEYMHDKGVDYFVCLDDWYQSSSSWGREVDRYSITLDNSVKATVVLKLK